MIKENMPACAKGGQSNIVYKQLNNCFNTIYKLCIVVEKAYSVVI